jgi:hypothetical protein
LTAVLLCQRALAKGRATGKIPNRIEGIGAELLLVDAIVTDVIQLFTAVIVLIAFAVAVARIAFALDATIAGALVYASRPAGAGQQAALTLAIADLARRSAVPAGVPGSLAAIELDTTVAIFSTWAALWLDAEGVRRASIGSALQRTATIAVARFLESLADHRRHGSGGNDGRRLFRLPPLFLLLLVLVLLRFGRGVVQSGELDSHERGKPPQHPSS